MPDGKSQKSGCDKTFFVVGGEKRKKGPPPPRQSEKHYSIVFLHFPTFLLISRFGTQITRLFSLRSEDLVGFGGNSCLDLKQVFDFFSVAVYEQPFSAASGKRSGTSYEYKMRYILI